MNFEELVAGQVLEQKGWWWMTEYGFLTFVNGDTDLSGVSGGYVRLCPATCIGTMPEDFNAVQVQVEAVDSQIEALKESYHQKLYELTEKRENLLALPAPDQMMKADDDYSF